MAAVYDMHAYRSFFTQQNKNDQEYAQRRTRIPDESLMLMLRRMPNIIKHPREIADAFDVPIEMAIARLTDPLPGPPLPEHRTRRKHAHRTHRRVP